jgi:hypothetical protein
MAVDELAGVFQVLELPARHGGVSLSQPSDATWAL